MKYGLRLLTLPFVIGLFIVRDIRDIIKGSYLYLKYGGEFMVYEKQFNGTLVRDAIDKILDKPSK